MTQHSRTRGRRLLAAALVASAALLAACSGASDNRTQSSVPPAGQQSTLKAKGPDARSIMDLFTPFFWIGVMIGVVVIAATIFVAVRFRARADDERPVQTHGHTGLEIGWTIVPALILAVMAVPTVAVVFDLAEEPDEGVEILVTGKQWWWEYEYVDEGFVTANEMHIPVGVPVSLRLTSDNVIHSFWVPNLAGKKDVVPGREHFLRIEADEPGLYLGQCAEYCGLSHANMRLRVIAQTPDDYEAWVASQQQGLTAEQQDIVDNGVIAKYGCAACHSFASTTRDVGARVGPNLAHFASRQTFAGAIFDRTDENLAEWVRDAPGMKPMQTGDQPGPAPNTTGLVPGMPAFPSMTDEEVAALVDFLQSLQ
jgi:cytochrome c oxidase subunit 2